MAGNVSEIRIHTCSGTQKRKDYPLAATGTDTVYYAIGDVHGVADRLKVLHGQILSDHQANHPGQAAEIIHLGDYLDRGEDSKGVVDMIMALEAEAANQPLLSVKSLMGNHEEMMLAGLDGDAAYLEVWLKNGGRETLDSYRLGDQDYDEIMLDMPRHHLDWLKSLPDILVYEEDRLIFVHAGVDTREYPNCRPGRRLWTRASTFFRTENWDNPELYAHTVVHGHTPTDDFFPDVEGDISRRINVDTGAVYGGRLTAVCLTRHGEPSFIYA